MKGRTICEIFNKIYDKYPGIVTITEFDNSDFEIDSNHTAILEVLHEVNIVPTTAIAVTPAPASAPRSRSAQAEGAMSAVKDDRANSTVSLH